MDLSPCVLPRLRAPEWTAIVELLMLLRTSLAESLLAGSDASHTSVVGRNVETYHALMQVQNVRNIWSTEKGVLTVELRILNDLIV